MRSPLSRSAVWVALWRSPPKWAISHVGTVYGREVARIVGRTPAVCRRLASAARSRVRAAQARSAPTARDAAVVRELKRAWESHDIDALVGLLDPAATAVGDGGDLVSTLRRTLRGSEEIARHLVHLTGRGTTLLERTVNGQPGLVGRQGGAIVTVYSFDVSGDRIRHLWAMRNPEKLRSWAAVTAA
ncbi:hypothetical protein ACQEV4_01610 [Streptomyces shenzhenensis]|uniref:hypothetical protein n=1 Tax=Streptomyces shenzhenensis TaxID=943815 RepID=UPI003D8FC43F